MVCQTIALTKAHSATYPGYVRCNGMKESVQCVFVNYSE